MYRAFVDQVAAERMERRRSEAAATRLRDLSRAGNDVLAAREDNISPAAAALGAGEPSWWRRWRRQRVALRTVDG
jgi:hypothetical protein